jgi:hypothetical protein
MDSLARATEASSSSFAKDRPSVHRRERSSSVKNRMREIRTSGSVRGEDGNILTYSASGFYDPAAFVEMMESSIAIGLQDASELDP